jgi:hypothetical protein
MLRSLDATIAERPAVVQGGAHDMDRRPIMLLVG